MNIIHDEIYFYTYVRFLLSYIVGLVQDCDKFIANTGRLPVLRKAIDI